MVMSDVVIEGVRDGDLAEILRNFERFWGDRDQLRRRDSGEIAGYLLGFVAPTGDGYIHFVAVRDDFLTLGLGRALYGTFEKVARERGAVALKAITSLGNEGSVAFHRSVGFTEMTRVEDYGGSGHARIVMRKPLPR